MMVRSTEIRVDTRNLSKELKGVMASRYITAITNRGTADKHQITSAILLIHP